jgi:aminotransferase EvaB
MKIKVWDYLSEYEEEQGEILAAIEGVLRSGQLILGDKVRNFEEAFARYCGVNYGVGVNSGTDALFLALKALGIGEGDEVITVANTAVPTVSAIVSAGAVPRFVDIDPDTYLMDTALLEKAITVRTKCILPVHLYGQCVDMEKVKTIADEYGLKVIEDCAQAHGASFKGRKAGSMSDVAAFSFYPTKVLGGYGDAGIVVTDSEEIYMKLRRLRFYGMDQRYYSEEHGYNSRLDELHASILLVKLSHLDDYIERREHIAYMYSEGLKSSGLSLPETLPGNKHVYYLYVCRHRHRDRIMAELNDRGIQTNVSYRWPVHIMPAYEYLGYKEGDLPETERSATEIFSLPMYPALRDEQVRSVIDAISQILD